MLVAWKCFYLLPSFLWSHLLTAGFGQNFLAGIFVLEFRYMQVPCGTLDGGVFGVFLFSVLFIFSSIPSRNESKH